jgi:hypothetical protein
MKVLKFYGRISGLNINTEKTKVIWIGSRKNSQETLCHEYNLSWEQNNFTILGITFSTYLSEIINLNYEKKIEEIKNLFLSWSKRMISPMGKIVVVKTLALAKLNHLILGIPNPPIEKIHAIQKQFYNFIWSNSKDKIKRKVLTQEYEYGGLKMVNLEKFMYSLKSTWLRRLLSMNDKFSHLTFTVCPALKSIYKFGTDYIKPFLNQNINPFWKDVMYSYYVLSLNSCPTNGHQTQTINIWFNPNIKVGDSSVFYKKWLAAGIVFIGDLINNEGGFYQYNEFITTFNINTNFLEFNGLLASVKRYLETSNFQLTPEKSYTPMLPLTLSFIIRDNKGCKFIYKHIMGKQEFPKSLQKWKNDLNNFQEVNFARKDFVYAHVFKFTQDPKLIWLQFRINHRILGTNYLLKKMNVSNFDYCSFCENQPETLIHLFWECHLIREFWNILKEHIQNTCNIVLENWRAYDIMFGNPSFDIVINKILLQAKNFIYYHKLIKKRPSLESFKKQVIRYYNIERYKSLLSSQHNYENQWRKYQSLIR